MRNRMLMVIDALGDRGLCVTRRRDDGVLLRGHAD
jgi:hypothetical protein